MCLEILDVKSPKGYGSVVFVGCMWDVRLILLYFFFLPFGAPPGITVGIEYSYRLPTFRFFTVQVSNY